jgi:uncharacterized hydrophobic protein (TIGR00271 family)
VGIVANVQDRFARGLGLEPANRPPLVRAMLQPRQGEAAGYWLQLMMAAALATLGLALDSVAVVIGAMLIAPLMKPIIALAMGLATGSASLVFRAGVRAIVSVIAVVAAAATIAWLLPFHEITRELAARTTPSLLDLFVAAACALVGAYATLFSSSEMASTAAGTSIGISLVPPLCTIGYALAIGEWRMAMGAALLFTANITGIITVAGVAFVVVGFGQVDVAAQAHEIAAHERGVANRIGRNFSRASNRLGPISRLVLPLLLLAAIFVPLRRAVGEMTRRTELRQEILRLFSTTKIRVAQSSIDLGGNGAVIRVVIVGDSHAQQRLDRELHEILTRMGEPAARLSVWAVPDAKALGALTTRIDELPPPIVSEPARDLGHHTPQEVDELARGAWPKRGTGALLASSISAGPPLDLHVTHLGAPLGEPGRELLQRALAPDEDLVVTEESLAAVEAVTGDAAAWVAPALALAEQARRLPAVALCVTVPVPSPAAKPPVVEDPAVTEVRAIVARALRDLPRATIVPGDRWSMVPTLDTCAQPAAGPAEK